MMMKTDAENPDKLCEWVECNQLFIIDNKTYPMHTNKSLVWNYNNFYKIRLTYQSNGCGDGKGGGGTFNPVYEIKLF